MIDFGFYHDMMKLDLVVRSTLQAAWRILWQNRESFLFTTWHLNF